MAEDQDLQVMSPSTAAAGHGDVEMTNTPTPVVVAQPWPMVASPRPNRSSTPPPAGPARALGPAGSPRFEPYPGE